VKDKRHKAQAELRRTRQEAHGVKLDINRVDANLENAREDLSLTEQHLKLAKNYSDVVSAELSVDTTHLMRTKGLVSRRIRRIYMQGNENALSTFSGTKSAGDVASRSYLMAAIERKDRSVFNQYIQLQKLVSEKKRQADRAVQDEKRLEAKQQSQTVAIATDRAQKAELLKDLQAKQSDLESMISQFESDERQIGNEIEAYERAMVSRLHGNGSHSLGNFGGRFLRPVGAVITSTFGMRYHPLLHRVRMHTGVDFGASFGTPIHAAATGVVIFSSYMNGYGHCVIIDHGSGFSTVYAHASRVFVSSGQRVRSGETIAAVGASGLATGPHLHFEVRVNGKPVNPLGHF
jgi:murein DD-endopeptidase MepM/ murein hydrolase activator NlpD